MRQREIKRRAFLNFSLGPNATIVALNNALHNREPYPRTLEFPTVQPLENAKKFFRVVHVEPGAIVPYKINFPSFFGAAAHFDQRLFFMPRKFKRIGKQVIPRLPQQSRVPAAVGQLSDLNLDLSRWLNLS